MNEVPLRKEERIITDKVLYIDGKGYHIVINGKLYPIIFIDSINSYKTIYSLPCNNRQEPWTSKSYNGNSRPEVIETMWGRYKPTSKITVHLENDVVTCHIQYQT